ncbi:uncharacterized protein LOC134776245 [Penaeus indicus]|uniref:uncharacterized protein LOC134776245 n=1 Tax=Penaeus indicus TaxID=29960 RepID=UPI00300D0087
MPLTFALYNRTCRQSPHEDRHLDFVPQFTTNIQHIQGTNNQAADALSRISIAMVSASNSPINFHLIGREQQQNISLSKLTDTILCYTSLGRPRPYIPLSLNWQFFKAYMLIRESAQLRTLSAAKSFLEPDGRFEHVHLDVVSPLPDDQGYSYVLTMINQFTRWPEAMSI